MAPLLASYPPACGCYVDSVRGIYMVDAIVALAEAFGFKAKGCEVSITDFCPRCHDGQHEAGDGSYTEWSRCQFAGEVEDEATDYLNSEQSVEGCKWGRTEQGDWGLWPDDDNDEGGQS